MASSSVIETREAILRGALEEFSHRGYAGATMAAIAKRAKVNALTIFRHFQGKDNLFREVVEHHSDIPLDRERLDMLLADTSAREGLSLLSRFYFEEMFKHIHIFRIFIIEATHFPEVKERSWRMPPRYAAYLHDYLHSLVPDSKDKATRVPLLTDMFLAHITRLTLQFNKHDSIWTYSEDLANAFSLKMQPQIEFFVSAFLEPRNTAPLLKKTGRDKGGKAASRPARKKTK